MNETARAKLAGNPDDLPFEVLRKIRKRHDGHKCKHCGVVNKFNTVARNDPWQEDSFRNLHTTCRSCNPEK